MSWKLLKSSLCLFTLSSLNGSVFAVPKPTVKKIKNKNELSRLLSSTHRHSKLKVNFEQIKETRLSRKRRLRHGGSVNSGLKRGTAWFQKKSKTFLWKFESKAMPERKVFYFKNNQLKVYIPAVPVVKVFRPLGSVAKEYSKIVQLVTNPSLLLEKLIFTNGVHDLITGHLKASLTPKANSGLEVSKIDLGVNTKLGFVDRLLFTYSDGHTLNIDFKKPRFAFKNSELTFTPPPRTRVEPFD